LQFNAESDTQRDNSQLLVASDTLGDIEGTAMDEPVTVTEEDPDAGSQKTSIEETEGPSKEMTRLV
jgi:hypothetical protein